MKEYSIYIESKNRRIIYTVVSTLSGAKRKVKSLCNTTNLLDYYSLDKNDKYYITVLNDNLECIYIKKYN